MKEILNGIIDMHVHNGPSTALRKYNTAEFCIEADKAGYKAFITKDHYFPSVMTAMQTNTILEGKVKTKAYGSLILNNSVGGITLKAVDVACAMDVKYLSLPTLSSGNHIEFYKGRQFPGASQTMTVDETPIWTDIESYPRNRALLRLKHNGPFVFASWICAPVFFHNNVFGSCPGI